VKKRRREESAQKGEQKNRGGRVKTLIGNRTSRENGQGRENPEGRGEMNFCAKGRWRGMGWWSEKRTKVSK